MASHATHKQLATRLSPDILFTIGHLVYPELQDIATNQIPENPHLQDDLYFKDSFADLSRVCRHWRYAFLSCPSFWSRLRLPERSISYLEEKLIRSVDYPLKVTIHYHSHYLPQMLARQSNILFTHLHRIQSLIIHQSHEYNNPIPSYILSLITNPAPKLKVFHFDFNTVIGLKRLVSATERFVPETLFANHAPNLEEFGISIIKLSRNNLPNFKTIRRLSLVFVHGLTHYGLLNILEAVSCNLEALEIVSPENFPWPFRKCEDHRPLIPLSSLRTLRLSVNIEILLVVVSHTTDIPLDDLRWNIVCEGLIFGIDIDITPFVSFLAKIRKGSHTVFSIDSDVDIKFGKTSSGPYNILRFSMGCMDEEDLVRFKAVLSAMDLSNVNSCELNYPLPFWMEEFERMFQPFLFHFNRLESLSVRSHNILASLQYLRPRTTSMETIIILPCPLLRDLKLGLVASTDEASGLIENLVARKEAGNTLTYICVEYENRLEEFPIKQDLMKLVENVEMIGKCRASEEKERIELWKKMYSSDI